MAEKEFPASIKRLEKARKEGKVIKTRYVSLAASCWALLLLIPTGVAWVRSRTLVEWNGISMTGPGTALSQALWTVCGASALFLGGVACASALVGFVQTRGLLALSSLTPQVNRLSPLGFFSRSKEGLIDTALGFGRCGILFIALAPLLIELVQRGPELLRVLANDEAAGGVGVRALTQQVWRVCIRSALVITAIAVAAYGLAWWKFMRQHRMSLQELRDEYKESEGDPHIRSARRHEHEALITGDLAARVKKAKVIIVRRRTEA